MIDFSGRVVRARVRSIAVASAAACFGVMPLVAFHGPARADGIAGPAASRHEHGSRYAAPGGRDDRPRPRRGDIVINGRALRNIVPGRSYTFPYTITNRGNGPARHVVFRASPDKNLHVTATPPRCSWKGRSQLICRIGLMPQGQTRRGSIRASVAPRTRPGTSLSGPADVTWRNATTPEERRASFPNAAVAPGTDLAVTSSTPGSADASGRIPYEVTVTNQGPVTAESVVVRSASAPNEPCGVFASAGRAVTDGGLCATPQNAPGTAPCAEAGEGGAVPPCVRRERLAREHTRTPGRASAARERTGRTCLLSLLLCDEESSHADEDCHARSCEQSRSSGRHSILGGNQIHVPVTVPINACGNGVGVLGVGEAACNGGAGGSTVVPTPACRRCQQGGSGSTAVRTPTPNCVPCQQTGSGSVTVPTPHVTTAPPTPTATPNQETTSASAIVPTPHVTTPGTPNVPTTPGTPNVPTTPGTPNVPTTPEVPGTPGVPEVPSHPGHHGHGPGHHGHGPGECVTEENGFVCPIGALPPGGSRTVHLLPPHRYPHGLRCVSRVESGTPDLNHANDSAACHTRAARPLPRTGSSSAVMALWALGLTAVGLALFRLGRARRSELD